MALLLKGFFSLVKFFNALFISGVLSSVNKWSASHHSFPVPVVAVILLSWQVFWIYKISYMDPDPSWATAPYFYGSILLRALKS
jgi:hypothetical protein